MGSVATQPIHRSEAQHMSGMVGTIVKRAIVVRDEEIRGAVLSLLFHFLVLAAYFVIRPIRDQMGLVGGTRNLAWLFSGTLLAMVLLHPLYTALVSRMPRRDFVAWSYRFFVLNLGAFFVLFRFADADQSVWLARIFFIWTSAFNLFVVTVFWSFMADVFRPGQSKRIFGFVAVGGTIGAVTGSGITATLVGVLGPINLLLVSALLLELAYQASNRLSREEPALERAAQRDEIEATGRVPETSPEERVARRDEVIGGGVMDGVRQVLRSPYLLGIALLMVFFTVASTFLWFHRMHMVDLVYGDDPVGATRLFATMETTVQMLTAIIQVFLTARILRWFGVGLTLAFLPVVSLVGFAILGAVPTLAVVVVFEVLRRASNFALQRPTREVLYTVLPREEKFKAKHFNDTAVYRFGDQVGAWSYTWLGMLGLGMSALAFTMVPLSAGWLLLALWLGHRNRQLEEQRAAKGEPVHVPA
jgi:ATP:ADP antiporter, AAA family